MIVNTQSKESLLRKEYAAMTRAEREGEKGKDLRNQIQYLNNKRLQGSRGTGSIVC